jgi:hypothetical protein
MSAAVSSCLWTMQVSSVYCEQVCAKAVSLCPLNLLVVALQLTRSVRRPGVHWHLSYQRHKVTACMSQAIHLLYSRLSLALGTVPRSSARIAGFDTLARGHQAGQLSTHQGWPGNAKATYTAHVAGMHILPRGDVKSSQVAHMPLWPEMERQAVLGVQRTCNT